jgi:hypothetical protein
MFDQNSTLVQNYVLLIREGRKTIDDVPIYSNLRDVVSDALHN